MEILWWCIDTGEIPVVQYEISWWWELHTSFILQDNKVVDQSLDKRYWYACVFFGEANACNEVYNQKKIQKTVSWEHIAEYAIAKKLLDIYKWAAIIDWPKAAVALWLIDWYAQVETVQDIKQALVNEWCVSVWSNRINWNKVRETYIVEEWNSYWHKFIIVWYDDNKKYFICENSYWIDKYDKWRFYLQYKDIWLLYNTKTVWIVNNNNFKLLDKYLKLSKQLKYKEYSEHNKNLIWDEKMIANIAGQIRYIGKVNNKKEFSILFK